MVGVAVRVRAPMGEPGPEHADPDRDHHQAGDEVEPGIEILGHDQLRERERHHSEREHARGVRHRDDAAEPDRVPDAASLADEVGGDDRLPVARAERVRGAPEQGDRERGEDAGSAQVARSTSEVKPDAGFVVSRAPRTQAPPRARYPLRASPWRRSRRPGSRAGPSDTRAAGRRADGRGARRRRCARRRWRGRRPPSSRAFPDTCRRRKLIVACSRTAGPASTTSSRVVRSPAAPGRNCSRCLTGRSVTLRPSTVSDSFSAIDRLSAGASKPRPGAPAAVGISAMSST